MSPDQAIPGVLAAPPAHDDDQAHEDRNTTGSEDAPTPRKMGRLEVTEIDQLIRTSSFHEAKAKQIHAIARRTEEEFGGTLPADAEVRQSFAGVGPKCANLALGVAAGVNRLLVPFGKHICTGIRPKCSVCPVLEYCRQVGVTEHR